ncbi:MAG: hypothetical protein WBK08_04210 [Nitrospira sp.]|nr:MAG: hypothetical protein E8D42_08690 [Nitrospira sp.]
MTLINLADSLIVLGVFLAMIGFVFGSILENQKVRTLLEDLWAALTVQVESPMLLRARTLEITAHVFGALYHRHGKLSYLKLFAITFVFTVSGCIAVYVDGNKNPRPFEDVSNVMGLFTFAFIWSIGSYLYEYGAYRISRCFLSKATQQNNTIYLGINLAVLILVLYGLPALLMYFGSTQFRSDNPGGTAAIYNYLVMAIFFAGGFSPALPVFYLLKKSNYLFDQILMYPAALSFCFPVALTLGSIVVLHNRWTLSVLMKSLERISSVHARRIRNSSVALLGFVVSAIGIIDHFWPNR